MKHLPENPFESIALCMSGGGYRAASFHLGAMSYLHNVNLLDSVTAISTVSGGTITGVMYALYKERGEFFPAIYDRLIGQLRERDLIKEGIAKLKLDGQWENTTKRRNLINALSEIYDEHFTEGATFAEFLNPSSQSHLKLVLFNATEFDKGINFRFQNRGVLGNAYFKIKKEEKKEIKLADIIAASSCFPGGFEPIGFPRDFIHPDAKALVALKEEKYQEDIGLMDGGIYDNQGIDGILRSEKRNDELYDLIIISDVSSPDMKSFTFHKTPDTNGFRVKNLKGIVKFIRRIKYWVLGVLIAIGGIAFLTAWKSGFSNNIWTGLGIGVLGMVVFLLMVFLIINASIRKLIAKAGRFIKKQIPEFYYEQLSALDLTDYRVGDYEPLLMDRINSLSKLLQDVFLKQIRRLNYAKINESDEYEFRRISNLSKELTEEKLKKSISKLQNLANCPSDFQKSYRDLLGSKLPLIINEAAAFGTNLWFTEDDNLNQMLDKLIVSGQFNMCFNLLEYVLKLSASKDFAKYPEPTRIKIESLKKQLVKDWKSFVGDPGFMLS